MIMLYGIEIRALHNFIQQAKKQPVKIKWLFCGKGIHDGYFTILDEVDL
jgi:hypothetical protein